MNKNILVTPLGELQTNSYIIYCEDTRICAIIDPGAEPEKLIKKIESLKLVPKYILLTHGHYDHIGAISGLKKHFSAGDVKMGCHEKEKEMVANPAINYSAAFGDGFSAAADFTFKGGDVIEVGNAVKLEVIHTPGHTKGGCCFLYEAGSTLFSGDTLFAESVGRTDLFGGNMEELISSIRNKIFVLNDKIIVLPGHGPHTTIGREKNYNMYIH